MSLYPDNVNRANRVRQLASDISQIQSQLKADVEDARKKDAAALEILNNIATGAGFETLDAYIQDATKELSSENKQAFDKMKDDLDKLDNDMSLSHKVFRGLIAIGLVTKGIRIFSAAFMETQSILFGLQAVVKSVYAAITGAAQASVNLMTFGRNTLNLVSEGAGISTEALNSMKYLKIGGNILIAVGVIVDAGLLIAEAIQGADQRAALQSAIKDLCARRFAVKKIQQQARAILYFKSNVQAIVKVKETYKVLIDKKRMTVEEEAAELKPEMDKVESELKTAQNKITGQSVLDMLHEQDKASQLAWTTEDLSDLNAILQRIEDLKAFEEFLAKYPQLRDTLKTIEDWKAFEAMGGLNMLS